MEIFKLFEEAIEAEKKAQEAYRKGAQQAEDAETRALFEQLSKWEEGHQKMLSERLAALKIIKETHSKEP